jgi:hypothetical protein
MRSRALHALLAVFLAGALAHGDDYAVLQRTLERLASKSPTLDDMAAAFAQATNAPTVAIRSEAVTACAAGLIALGRSDLYAARIRKQVPDSVALEKSLRSACPACRGEGRTSERCLSCGGTGACGNTNCQRGKERFRGFNGRVTVRTCEACKGTSKCPACRGSGRVGRVCAACEGRGGSYPPDLALKVCREHGAKALEALERHRQSLPQTPPLRQIELLRSP